MAKRSKQIISVYRLISPSGKSYVGITGRGVVNRIHQHLRIDSLIGKALRKYGLENFRVEILWITPDRRLANTIEAAAIVFYNTKVSNGYNVASGGGNGGAMLDRKRPDISEKMKAIHYCSFQGHSHTEATKKEMGIAKMGDKNPMKNPETAMKVSKTMKENQTTKGKNNPMFGRKNPNSHSIQSEIKRLKTGLTKLSVQIKELEVLVKEVYDTTETSEHLPKELLIRIEKVIEGKNIHGRKIGPLKGAITKLKKERIGW